MRGNGVTTPIYKARKFRCTSVGGSRGARSDIRLVFAYYEKYDKVIYLEIYKKNKQSNHNVERIIKYFKG